MAVGAGALGDDATTDSEAGAEPDRAAEVEPASLTSASEAGPAPESESQPELVRPYIARHYQQEQQAQRELHAKRLAEAGDPPRPPRTRQVIDAETMETAIIYPDDIDRAEDDDPHEPGRRGRARTALALVGAVAAVFLAVGVVWAGGWFSPAPVAHPSTNPIVISAGPTTYLTSTSTATSATPSTRPTTPAATRTRTSPSPKPSATATRPVASTQPQPPPPPPPPATAMTGAFESTLVVTPKRCVDVRGRESAPGTVVQSYECNRTPAQIITVTTDGRLTVDLPGLRCIQPSGGGVVIDMCAAQSDQARFADQQWRVIGQTIRHLGTGRCLTIPGGNLESWIPLTLESCGNAPGQLWNLA